MNNVQQDTTTNDVEVEILRELLDNELVLIGGGEVIGSLY